MNAEKILKSAIINQTALAKLMWPGMVSPKTKLNQKIKNRDGQRLLDKDKELIVEVVKKELGI